MSTSLSHQDPDRSGSLLGVLGFPFLRWFTLLSRPRTTGPRGSQGPPHASLFPSSLPTLHLTPLHDDGIWWYHRRPSRQGTRIEGSPVPTNVSERECRKGREVVVREDPFLPPSLCSLFVCEKF